MTSKCNNRRPRHSTAPSSAQWHSRYSCPTRMASRACACSARRTARARQKLATPAAVAPSASAPTTPARRCGKTKNPTDAASPDCATTFANAAGASCGNASAHAACRPRGRAGGKATTARQYLNLAVTARRVRRGGPVPSFRVRRSRGRASDKPTEQHPNPTRRATEETAQRVVHITRTQKSRRTLKGPSQTARPTP